jgi:hypothetical protein
VSEPVEIRDGDLVLVNRAGLYVAWVQRAGARDLVIEPCDRSITDTRVRIDEVQAVYRLAGRPVRIEGRLRPAPRQLRFDDVDPPAAAS